MARPFPVLCAEARRRMHMNQRMFAEAVSSSLRTVQRWETARSSPVPADIHRIADAVRAMTLDCERVGEDILVSARMKEW